VRCLAWTKDGKTLISGSYDYSIRTWNTTKWEQVAILDEHTSLVLALAISPNGRILASTSSDNTTRLWNLDNGKLISSPLQHARQVNCVSFSAGGKLLATGCRDKNAYLWDVAAIIKEAGLDELLSHSKANKSALHTNINATRPPVQRRPPASQVPHGFFDGVSPAYSSARSRPHSSELPRSTLLRRLFHRDNSSSSAYDTSLSTPIDWARNLFKPRRQSGEGIDLQGRSPSVAEVPYAKGRPRNACAREKRQKLILPSKNSAASSSQPSKPNVTQPSSQPQLSTTPAIGDATAATTPPSCCHATIKNAGLWTRFWLFLGCLSPQYTHDHD
jgi:WD40 repeat protein